MSTVQASQNVPSALRPIPLRMRPDLKSEQVTYQGVGSFVVKDPITLKYFRFQREQFRILELLDGKRNLESIRETVQREFPAINLTLDDIQSLVADLHRSGLTTSDRGGQGPVLLKRRVAERVKKLMSFLGSLLYLRLPGWDPDWTLQKIDPFFKWMFTWWGVAIWFISVGAASTLFFVQFDTFRSRIPEFQQFFGWPNLLYMWMVLGAAKIVHEFGHGLCCKRFGGECHEMGVMLLVFSPTLYCDVTDSWMLKNKWKRIMIAAAGMYIEVLLSCFAIFGWWFSTPGLFNYLCLNLFFISTVSTVIFNANPLMRYDGYYMMADFLEIPNLRQKADKLLRDAFAWYCLGIESRPDPFMPQTNKGWFIAYAIACHVYRWVIMFGILLFFYTFLKPYKLQSIGATMALFSLIGVVVGMVTAVYRIISAPRIDPMDSRKVTITLTTVGLLIAAAALIPIPWSLTAAVYVEPYNVQHVYTTTPGQLVSIDVSPDQKVRAGQTLVRLQNTQKELEYERLKMEAAAVEAEINMHSMMRNSAREMLSEERLTNLRKQIADYADQLSRLEIRAPCDGIVVLAERAGTPKYDHNHARLPHFHGTPLDQRNLQTWLPPRTHILSIAPDPGYQAVMMIDQSDRNDVAVGEAVRIKLDHLPDQTYHSRIDSLSLRELEFAPRQLTIKAGGDLNTMTDNEGRERLSRSMYQAVVRLDEDSQLMRSGFRGRAKFVVARHTAIGWLMRWVRNTFNFKL